jgi:hypothetical protein
LLLLASRCLAEATDGGEAYSWLKLGVGARQTAMGQATTAMEGDAYAVNDNPSGLASLNQVNLGSQTALLSEDRRLDYLSYARPLSLSTWNPGIGMSVTRFSLESPIEERITNTPDPVGTWFQNSYAIQAGIGSWLGDGPSTHAALGLDFRFLSETLGPENGTGIALDLGSLYRAKPWLNLGWTVENLVSRDSWSNGFNESSTRSLKLGAAARAWDRRLLGTLDFEVSADQSLRTRVGLECWVSPGLLALRAGIDYDRFSAGLGLNWEIGGNTLALDYAFRTDPVLPQYLDHRFSLSLAFDPGFEKGK